jgi:hypothetical protein
MSLLRNDDFTQGALNQETYSRPNRFITIDEAIVVKSIGQISDALTQQVIRKLFEMIKGNFHVLV